MRTPREYCSNSYRGLDAVDATKKLDSLVDTYSIDTVTEQYKRLEFIAKLSSHLELASTSVLELGSASGGLTALLADRCRRVVAVDGSVRFLEIARSRVGNRPVEFVHAMFEDLRHADRFDLLVMHHILEHVDSPVPLLARLREFLLLDGLFAITVPNAYALSRQLAVKMGLLHSIYDLTENDSRHGHQRVYDWETLERNVSDAGYEIIGRHGLALKLFADYQNEKMVDAGIIGDPQLRGLWPMADQFREVAGAIMVILRSAADR
jgi:2-polyprenyl-3-methyl-5-hydroxy-6-metoxy-1,4-benzoquinol methylase